MYKLIFMPSAKKDNDQIVFYMRYILNNESASISYLNAFDKAVDKIMKLPHGSPIYYVDRKLLYEYRRHKVKNYIIFYIVDDVNKSIIIMRILYKKMNYDNLVWMYLWIIVDIWLV